MKQQNIDSEAVIKRLKRIEGQVRGVIRMVEENKNCEEILVQVSSIKSSVQKTGQSILEDYLHNCIVDSIRKGRADMTIRKVSSALEQFSRII
ncbi:MAG: metal-sensitive transcriptional regulator [Treponema sp.]|jgi:DNA-binding FrmR family transcriptional regulator|nr:metal-sensitive transcriptional regulator [Treponema sp.]